MKVASNSTRSKTIVIINELGEIVDVAVGGLHGERLLSATIRSQNSTRNLVFIYDKIISTCWNFVRVLMKTTKSEVRSNQKSQLCDLQMRLLRLSCSPKPIFGKPFFTSMYHLSSTLYSRDSFSAGHRCSHIDLIVGSRSCSQLAPPRC